MQVQLQLSRQAGLQLHLQRLLLHYQQHLAAHLHVRLWA